VDRAVDYATRRGGASRTKRLPDRRNHPNPYVNDRLRGEGIRFCPTGSADRLGKDDVVILPAFGVTVGGWRACRARAARRGHHVRIGPECLEERRAVRPGRVHVHHSWKVARETRATASQAHASGRYLVVLDRAEAAIVCDYIRHNGDSAAFLSRFHGAMSPGFDPDRDLRIGCANQTTMLMTSRWRLAEMFRQAMSDRFGDAAPVLLSGVRHICSATQSARMR
jgi:4-hydroxy-3-methylbut-2-enyl diphosphate reductase